MVDFLIKIGVLFLPYLVPAMFGIVPLFLVERRRQGITHWWNALLLPLPLLVSVLSGLALPLVLLALPSIASGGAPATIELVHPETGARVVCSNPVSRKEIADLLGRLPRPLVFGAWGALIAEYHSGRIPLVEYCAGVYELANYVRWSAPFQPSRGATYVHSTYRWSVTYPDFWHLDDTNPRSVMLSRGMAVVGIHTFAIVSGKPLDEVAAQGLQGWGQHLGNTFEVVGRRRLTLAKDLPAIEVVHHIGKTVVGKSRKVIAVVKERGFLIDAETYLEVWEMFEPDFNRIIDSFSVEE